MFFCNLRIPTATHPDRTLTNAMISSHHLFLITTNYAIAVMGSTL